MHRPIHSVIALVGLLLCACGSSAAAAPHAARICAAAPCTGAGARITVWRTSGGEVGRYVYDGSMSCSHPPRVYYDSNGTEIATIASEPVVAGSEEQRAITERQRELVSGLTEAETISCR